MTSTEHDRPRTWPLRVAVMTASLLVVLAGCVSTVDSEEEPAPDHGSHADGDHGESSSGQDVAAVPLRDGERRRSVTMSEPYQPTAPTENGTDDYRCFLLDPDLDEDVFVTGTNVVPGNTSQVHHVILFQLPPGQVEAARTIDRSAPGQGWGCFGGSGLEGGGGPQAAPWLGAWTPGGSESVLHDGYGVPLDAGSQLVMQVHYSLLDGNEPDVTTADLRITDGSAALSPVSTSLLPAPVELPCRPEHADGPLCGRDAALMDVQERFGAGPGSTADFLLRACPGAEPGPEQSCTTTVSQPGTIIGAAGHMHLLGKSIHVELNPGTSRARTVLDVPVWNFHDQGAVPIEPIEVARGDRIRVTCVHDQSLRDDWRAFDGQAERYVLWAEGTTDEMCGAILQVASS